MRAYAYLLLTPLWVLGPAFDIVDGCADPSQPCRRGSPDGAARAVGNDNRRSAGTLRRDTLDVALVAQPARWFPESDTGQSLPVLAFAEEGRAPTVPGPLLRVPAGTIVRARVRNATGRTLWLRGFHERPLAAASERLGPDSTRTFTFALATPGTYTYGATLAPLGPNAPPRAMRDDSQLVGAVVVDPSSSQRSGSPRAAGAPRDRILVVTRWVEIDSSGPAPRLAWIMTAMNGRSWPHTERLAYAEGDSVRWRVINGSASPHPMHLHGFYFRVTDKRTFTGDTMPVRGRLLVTEALGPGQTMRVAWQAERAGNWLFHCHILEHMSVAQRLDRRDGGRGVDRAGQPTHASHANHATDGMAGLIVGIEVRPRKASVAGRSSPPRRTLRLFANARPPRGDEPAAYGFVLQDGNEAPAPDSVRRPGSTIVLRRGEPVQITVFNRLAVALSVHWHGLELDSYFDGVGDWSGSRGHVAPPIAPGDSFVVRLTPPRAGTFMYHVHGEDGHELAHGLYAPLLVLDDPAARDTTVDHVLLVSDSSARRGEAALVNGSTAPRITLVAGRANRLRIIGITGTLPTQLVVTRGADTVPWRLVARDGAELTGTPEPLVPARWQAGPGTVADFELTPTEPGELTLHVAHGTINVAPTAPSYTVRRWKSAITVVKPPVTLGTRR